MKLNSLESVYQYYVKDVYRYLYSLSYDHHTAEDLVQETFYRAYLFLEDWKEERIKPWLFRVAHNAYVDYQRKASRSIVRNSVFFDQLIDRHTPENILLQQEAQREIGQMLTDIPEKQRQVVLLVDFHQFSYQEAAVIMGITLSHIKITLFRARQRLREMKRKDGML
ncbi:sigma-70 family RNA polymerase sigma factor [Paenibacillus lautus]|uniref:sigma-70 family RNA polymerase sigma factor n=1 Tax=Paenibacillus lautus TaxID=1401 RepID=UPI001C12214D|nr:sigma-70 family RNA polymerase sigma factor [Paenibacillus lautus]MBU5347616.1 sigma-70 family RNA polymerase sigma factor [Paenibacillus lautus]